MGAVISPQSKSRVELLIGVGERRERSFLDGRNAGSRNTSQETL